LTDKAPLRRGLTGRGTTVRSGFERLLTEVCEGKIGAVLALEISRLARNGREWHTLMEFCAAVGTLLMDEHGVYDPRLQLCCEPVTGHWQVCHSARHRCERTSC
jgi:hypothetical protein